MKPLARRDGLVIRSLADETLVYDRERHQAHCLDRVAGIVFQHCDGTRSPEEIAALLDEGELPAAREATVSLALEQLSAARLLVEVHEHGTSTPGSEDRVTSRRELLRLTALAVPMIASIVAPTPAQAASACLTNAQCFDLPKNACSPCQGGCNGSWVCDPNGNGCLVRNFFDCP